VKNEATPSQREEMLTEQGRRRQCVKVLAAGGSDFQLA